MTIDDFLDFFTPPRPSKDQQQFESSIRWYLSRHKFVFQGIRVTKDGDLNTLSVTVRTPSGKVTTVQSRPVSKDVIFSEDSAESMAYLIIKSGE